MLIENPVQRLGATGAGEVMSKPRGGLMIIKKSEIIMFSLLLRSNGIPFSRILIGTLLQGRRFLFVLLDPVTPPSPSTNIHTIDFLYVNFRNFTVVLSCHSDAEKVYDKEDKNIEHTRAHTNSTGCSKSV